MSATYDIAIVGAGIVGAACANECARRGLKVLVLDRGIVGGGVTGAGMGHVVVMDDSPAQFALTHYSRQLWRQLADELPPNVEYDACGTLWVAADEQEMTEARRKLDFLNQHGVSAELLGAADLRRAEPNLRSDLLGGLLVHEDLVIYPPDAARFLLEQAQRRGAQVRLATTVHSILAEGGVILAGGERIAAGLTVNAAGCDSPGLTPGLPVRPRKGHLVITDRYPGYVHHQIVELGYLKSAHASSADSVAFNVQPRRTGQLLIGSSRQFDAGQAAIDPPILQRMLERARHYIPSLQNLLALRIWTGHRPATPDKLPFIGPTPENDLVWLATGHEGLGITTSLGTAHLLTDSILGTPTEIPVAPYSPARLEQAHLQHG